MKTTRRFILGIPLALAVAPKVSEAAVTAPAPLTPPREPFVNLRGFVNHLGDDLYPNELPPCRSCWVLDIGEWNGQYYPITVQGWFENTHIVPDIYLNDYTKEPWREDYYRRNELHWDRYDRPLVPERYVRALRGLKPYVGRSRMKNPLPETFLLDPTGATWPKTYKWENGMPHWGWG